MALVRWTARRKRSATPALAWHATFKPSSLVCSSDGHFLLTPPVCVGSRYFNIYSPRFFVQTHIFSVSPSSFSL